MSNKMSDIATQVVFEDDEVRVWNQVVPAGGEISKHEHQHDYFLVNVAFGHCISCFYHSATSL